jgi:hypothetical protein
MDLELILKTDENGIEREAPFNTPRGRGGRAFPLPLGEG